MATKTKPTNQRHRSGESLERTLEKLGYLPVPREVRKIAGVTIKDFARLIGFSERAIAEWESGKPLSEPARRKLAETQRLVAALGKLVEPESIPDWLRTPNDAFGGLKPLEVIERGETDRLWRMLFYLESGVAT
jgi:transcriptional regulator with XRE-family HTH domain